MATAGTKLMTAVEFAALEINAPVELIRGEVVEMPRPGMRHGVICRNVVFSIESWIRREHAGYLAVPESGVITEHDPDTVRGPDLYVVRRDRLPDQTVIPGFLEIPPDLCIEVVSPNDLWKDVIAKVDEYLQAGVREVWVIEPDERQVYCYRPDGPPRTLGESDVVACNSISGLAMSGKDVFRDIP